MTLSRFVKTYNNILLAERDMVCCVIEDEGITWKLAYTYLKEGGKLADKIQKKLEDLKLI